MKRISTLLLSLALQGLCLAQTFEGHIKYNITVKLDEKLQKASAELNSPANQEKMKMLEQQMKDPQFQKMMESNPQLKTQMENMIKAQSGGGAQNLMPKSSTIYVKNGNSLTKTEGGTNAEYLYLKDKKQSYQLFRDRKAYWILNSHSAKDSAMGLKAVKTTETAKILGYNCTKYIVKDPKGFEMFFWTTTEFKGIDYEQLKQQYSQGHDRGIQGLDGVSLKVEVKNPQMEMVMEVAEIKKETVDASMFVIPADFKEEKMPSPAGFKH